MSFAHQEYVYRTANFAIIERTDFENLSFYEFQVHYCDCPRIAYLETSSALLFGAEVTDIIVPKEKPLRLTYFHEAESRRATTVLQRHKFSFEDDSLVIV